MRGLGRTFWLSLLLLGSLPNIAPAAAPELGARLSCEPTPAPGRVRCALELAVASDLRLSWVDALVVATPEFARPLRSRVPQRKLTGKDSKAEVHLALLASSTGRGTLTVRGRAVVCPRTGTGACRPVSNAASVELVVGR
ncbi:MAG TPA: hypothetical protein VG937_35980 [Polyangiaceae bacterium]|nr:hypothetical protein [Polyangiaceae bacterium]